MQWLEAGSDRVPGFVFFLGVFNDGDVGDGSSGVKIHGGFRNLVTTMAVARIIGARMVQIQKGDIRGLQICVDVIINASIHRGDG